MIGSDVTIYFIRGARNILALEPTPGEPLSLLRKQQARLLSQRIDQGAIGAVTLTLCAVVRSTTKVITMSRHTSPPPFPSLFTFDYYFRLTIIMIHTFVLFLLRN